MAEMHWSDVMLSLPARAPARAPLSQQGTKKPRLVINAAGLLVPATAASAQTSQPQAGDDAAEERGAGGASYADGIKIGALRARRALASGAR